MIDSCSRAEQVYHRTAQFPDGGKMTMGFDALKTGDKVEFKGPLGSFEWLGSGMARWKGVERKASQIGMICGGSGKFFRSSLWIPTNHSLTTRYHTDHSSSSRSDSRRGRLYYATLAARLESGGEGHPPPFIPR